MSDQNDDSQRDLFDNLPAGPGTQEPAPKKGRKKAEDAQKPEAKEAEAPSPSPFNPASLRCPVVGYSTTVKRVRTNLKVRTPAKEWFVRTHPDQSFWMAVWGIELKETREHYVAVPGLTQDLQERGIGKLITLALAVNRQGEPFFWPLRNHNPEDKRKADTWLTSAREAAEMAKHEWVRCVANMAEQQYVIFTAQGELPDPEFPKDSMETLLTLAFKGSLIESMDHPIIRELEGKE
jgi:hypothetical protein